MLQTFGYLSGVLAILGHIPYLRDILRLKTKPQRTTFFIWSVLGSIATFSQLAKGASNSLWLPACETFLLIATFILSIRYGVGGFGKKDYSALLVAISGLILWYFTKEAAIAIYTVIIVDLAGTYLTVDKAYKDPKSETLISWVASSLAGLAAAIAVGSFDIVLLSYPLYILFANGAVVVAMKLGSRRNRQAQAGI